MAQQSSDQRVCVGIIAGAHGLRGLLRVRPFTDTPEDVAAYGPVETEDGTRSLSLSVANRLGKGLVLVRAEGVADRNAAEALKGTRLFVARDRLPAAEDDEFYYSDLIGLAAVDGDGVEIGRIRAVHEYGAGDSLEIAGADGSIATIPFTRAAVPQVDIAGGRVVVDAGQLLRSREDRP
ncbi:MAG: ribosome maturation factor RimM [Alphaproteobacteria bacterium]|jgi:16S rRNA processing protein RimM